MMRSAIPSGEQFPDFTDLTDEPLDDIVSLLHYDHSRRMASQKAASRKRNSKKPRR